MDFNNAIPESYREDLNKKTKFLAEMMFCPGILAAKNHLLQPNPRKINRQNSKNNKEEI